MSEHSSAMRTFESVRRGIMPMPHRGRHTFNMLYIGNLASAITTASLSGEGVSGTFHVNEGPYTLREVIAAISSEMGSGKGYVRIPGPALLLTAMASEAIAPLLKGPPPFSMTKYRALTSDIWNIGSSRIRDVFQFSAPFSLEEGVRRTCIHYGWSGREERSADHSSP
jgi:nucleoside-diphosphate-sugar epimerase